MTKAVDSLSDAYDEEYFEKLRHVGHCSGVDSRIYFAYTLRRWLRGRARVLDMGCGDAFFVRYLARYCQAVGMDISAVGLQRAGKSCTTCLILLGSAQYLPFCDESLEAVLALDVIEHLTSPEDSLVEAYRVLKRGGRLVLTTPNPGSLGRRWRGANWFAYRDATHLNIREPAAWRLAVQAVGFRVLRDGTDGLWDLPYPIFVPAVLQRLIFIPLNVAIKCSVGCLPWMSGENYVVLAERR